MVDENILDLPRLSKWQERCIDVIFFIIPFFTLFNGLQFGPFFAPLARDRYDMSYTMIALISCLLPVGNILGSLLMPKLLRITNTRTLMLCGAMGQMISTALFAFLVLIDDAQWFMGKRESASNSNLFSYCLIRIDPYPY
mmetsp:Transcript_45145/g.51863  ORF Transcript_45145/g.51863 Transcript_45145/m.51863 type:complete len:140 (-) Transcript_45145:327-746(-)